MFVIFMSMSIWFVWFGFFKHFVQWKNKEEGRAGQLANETELERERKESGQSHSTEF